MSRDLMLIVRAAAETGFTIEMAGETVAAMATPEEVAMWVQRRLEQLPGELERRRQDTDGDIVEMPNIVARTDPAGWWRKQRGGG
jgi:hypothetical protein